MPFGFIIVFFFEMLPKMIGFLRGGVSKKRGVTGEALRIPAGKIAEH